VEDSADFILYNIREVKDRIKLAAGRAGTDPGSITLMAVSKTHPAEYIETAHRGGISDFGESFAQEAKEKVDQVDLPVKWHFVGHLQKNKVRPVVERFDMIQSVDSMGLLARIDKVARQLGKIMEVLLQVNLTGEESKYGLDPGDVKEILGRGETLENVKIQGLMLIPPYYDDPWKNRGNFAAMRELAQEIDRQGYANWSNRYLSMGMTDDFEVAISEGSNMIRVGRAIFGTRRRK